jgi:hypothetical protein
MLQSTIDILVTNACVASYLDVASCKGYAYYPSPQSNGGNNTAELDDSREEDDQARKDIDDMDDSESPRLGEEGSTFSMPAFLLPLLPFSYLSESVSDEIFRTRQLPIETTETLSTDLSNNMRLCRCQAWSQDSENLASGDVTDIRSRHSEICVLHWDEAVVETSAIDYQRRRLYGYHS